MRSPNLFILLLALSAGSASRSVLSEEFKKEPPSKAAVPKALASSTLESDRDFSRAEELFKSGDEAAAAVSLTDFLRRHSTSARADDAQYLLGEIEFRKRNFDAAIRELKKTLNYRKQGGDRVADAYYLIGESFLRLGDSEKARIEWEALRRAYPTSAAASRASLKLMELVP